MVILSYNIPFLKKITFDYRELQYTYKDRHDLHKILFVQDREARSVAWHPTKPLLVTTGERGLTKLWDIETGNLLNTKKPDYHEENVDSISWSSDGELFLSDGHINSGETGDHLSRLSNDISVNYDSYEYRKRAGRSTFLNHLRGNAHTSSSHNFTPWRPHSHQFITFKNNIIIHNGRTGEAETIIDCDEPSTIEDIAWHPGGRFIAVAFKDSNVRIIDIENFVVLANLPSKHLVGWSPDGKILVLRKIWDGKTNQLQIYRTSGMTETDTLSEIEKKIWFQRLLKNMSADNKRYLVIEKDKKTPYNAGKVNIFSLESDELVASLSFQNEVHSRLSK